jgi:hypothetical protein
VVIGLLMSTVLDLPPLVKVGLCTFAFVGMTGKSLLYGQVDVFVAFTKVLGRS